MFLVDLGRAIPNTTLFHTNLLKTSGQTFSTVEETLAPAKVIVITSITISSYGANNLTGIDVVKLLKDLVSYISINDPDKGIKPSREVVDFINEWLTPLGLSTEIIESNGYYSILGFLGKEPPCVGLLAHYDTVPVVRERWTYNPFELTVVDGKAYGRGALDDKSNVAAIMVALERLSRVSLGCGVVFAFTGDEEVGGRNGAHIISQKLREAGSLPRYLINGDGVGMAPIIRRRKAFSVEISLPSRRYIVRGLIKTARFTSYYPVSQHAHAAYFLGGVDSHPLIAVSTLIRETGGLIRSLRGTFLKSNVVPPEVELEYIVPDPNGIEMEVDEGLTDLVKALVPLTRAPIRTRAFSEYGVSITPNFYSFAEGKHKVVIDVRAMARHEDVESGFREVLENILPGADLRIRTDPGDYQNTSPTSRVVTSLAEALRDEGVEVRLIEGAGASDSRYFTPFNVEVVDIGPRGGNMHGDNEYVELESLVKLPNVYYKAVKHLTNT